MILFVSWKLSLLLISRATIALVDIQITLLRAAHGFLRAVDWYKPWMVKILSTIYLATIALVDIQIPLLRAYKPWMVKILSTIYRLHKASKSAHSFESYYFV